MINISRDERIKLIKRRHSFVLFSKVFPFLLLFVITIGAMVFVFVFLKEETLSSIAFLSVLEINITFSILFILSLFLLFILQFIFFAFAHFYLDCWIITNQRTIHTELRGLFSRIYSTVPHSKVQDVSIDIHGFFPMILKYGDLKIQTAGAFKKFILRQIPDPHGAKTVLLEARRAPEERSYGEDF